GDESESVALHASRKSNSPDHPITQSRNHPIAQFPLSGPAYFLDVYRANLKMAIAVMAQYRFAILIWAVWGFVGPLISLAVWSAATAARGSAVSNGSATFGRADFAAYFLIFMIFAHLTMSWDAFEFAYRIRDGQLSP